jgi:hypothetical protein
MFSQYPTQTHILFFVTAVGCGACEIFNRQWAAIKQAIQYALGSKIIIEEIELPSRNSAHLDTSKYPPTFARFIGWFPIFILMDKNLFIKSKNDPSVQLAGIVFNGDVPSDPMKQVKSVDSDKRKTPNNTNLIQWIENELAIPRPIPSLEYLNNNKSTVVSNTPTTPIIPPIVVESHDMCRNVRLKSKFK